MNQKITLLKKKEIKELAEIFKKSFSCSVYAEKWNTENSIKRITEVFEKNKEYCFIAKIDEQIIGAILCSAYQHYNGKIGFIEELFISSKLQSKGLGTKLIEKAEQNFKQKRIIKTVLLAHTKASAFKFYKKKNYKENYFVQLEKEI